MGMPRRTFLLTPFALAAAFSARSPAAHAAPAGAPTSTRVAISFPGMGVRGRPLWLDLERMDPGDISIQVNLWLRMDVDPPPAGGILVKPRIRIIQDSRTGRRPLLNSTGIAGKSAPNSNEVHIVGSADGVSHDNVFSLLGLEFSIYQAFMYSPGQKAGAAVSTIPGKDSFIVVTSK
jgi:hypothetical protein